MKKIELLAPAGNFEVLKAAVLAGCDAVYIGGKSFGARSYAGNFTNEEIIDAVKYTHLFGVKLYVTVNTLIYEDEVDEFVSFASFLHKSNIDALIVQDIGMMMLLRKKFPNLEIHASTQMNVHNTSSVKLLKKLGIKRVVMAREVNLELIKQIKSEVEIEIESFVHGALCISYSGQCLMSSLIGNRSGNRGSCVQNCRNSYDLYDENHVKMNKDNFLLSTKDLCLLENIGKLIESGIDSFKIEGRMKKASYVYLVVSIYRKAIDNYLKSGISTILDEDLKYLKKAFNRGFTKGFMFDEENEKIVNQFRPNHQGVVVGKVIKKEKNKLLIKTNNTINLNDGLRFISKNGDYGFLVQKMYKKHLLVKEARKGDEIWLYYDKDVPIGSVLLKTTDYLMEKEVAYKIRNASRKVLIDMKITIKTGKPVLIEILDAANTCKYESNIIPVTSQNRPITKDFIIKQLSKTGDTIYKVGKIEADLDDNLFVDIKQINEIRREAIKLLSEKRMYNIEYIDCDYKEEVCNFKRVKESSILINTEEDYLNNKGKYDYFYSESLPLCNKYQNIIFKVPRINNNYITYNNKVLISEFGSILEYRDFETDFSFNVTNSYSVCFLHNLGAKKVTLSYELSNCQIESLVKEYEKRYKAHPNLEIIALGYEEAMISKFDLNKMYKIKTGYLKDHFNNEYKVVSKKDYMVIYNYRKRNLGDFNKYYAMGINSIRINLSE
ncbi:MAG: U32 family peptidase [Bacilli bacterium]